MANCRVCKRKLGTKHAAAGIGPICAAKERGSAGGSSKVKITFLSHPRTKRNERRSWLYRVEGEPSRLIRIYPDPEGEGRTANCDCPAGKAKEKCEHLSAVAEADKRKFYGEGTETK